MSEQQVPEKANESTLKKTLLECHPFRESAASIVCIGCFKLLAFPAGAKKIKCPHCNTLTDGIKIRCTACQHEMKVALSTTSVNCKKCKYNFQPIATLRIKAPAWADDPGAKMQLELTISIDESVANATNRMATVKVVPTQSLRTLSTLWEEDMGADFRSIGFFIKDASVDSTKSPMTLGLKDGDIIEIRRVTTSNASGHEFINSQFGAPTNCAMCKDFIWGIYHQGKKCAKCNLPVHHRCADKITSICESQRRAMYGIVNFDDEDDEAEGDAVQAVMITDEDKTAFASAIEEKTEPECDPNFMAGLAKISHFSDAEISEMWANYDADGSGELERDEMKTFMSDLVGAGGGSWSDNDNNELAVDRMIARMDTNGDGAIQWEEFWFFYKAQQDDHYLAEFAGAKLSTDQLYELWYHYDADGSGTLETDELLQLLSDLADQSGENPTEYKGKFESLLEQSGTVTWDMFYSTIVPIIQSSLALE
jgi:LSD1 subclass zinc finger protein